MRAIWYGALSFGLVNIPVKLYSAAEERELKFHLLHRDDVSPVRYARVCIREEKEVPYEELVKGFEVEEGRYVVLTNEDFKNANVRKSKTIEIFSFVEKNSIDPKYYESPYYLEPSKGSEKPYALLAQALISSGKASLGKFVLRQKEILCIISSENSLLVLNRLRFNDQLRKPENLKIPAAENLNQDEINLAVQLVNQMSAQFEPEKYQDTYTEELKEVIAKKSAGEMIEAKGKEPSPTHVDDLMNVLRASLEAKK